MTSASGGNHRLVVLDHLGMSKLGGVLPAVDTDPATMPIAIQAPARPPTAVEQYRALPWQEMREGLVLEAKLARQTMQTPEDDEQKRLSRNELGHFVATLLTGGLWGPVWLFVFLRNARRHGRTAQGRATAGHLRTERARLSAEQKTRRADVERAVRAQRAQEWRSLGRKVGIGR